MGLLRPIAAVNTLQVLRGQTSPQRGRLLREEAASGSAVVLAAGSLLRKISRQWPLVPSRPENRPPLPQSRRPSSAALYAAETASPWTAPRPKTRQHPQVSAPCFPKTSPAVGTFHSKILSFHFFLNHLLWVQRGPGSSMPSVDWACSGKFHHMLLQTCVVQQNTEFHGAVVC